MKEMSQGNEQCEQSLAFGSIKKIVFVCWIKCAEIDGKGAKTNGNCKSKIVLKERVGTSNQEVVVEHRTLTSNKQVGIIFNLIGAMRTI